MPSINKVTPTPSVHFEFGSADDEFCPCTSPRPMPSDIMQLDDESAPLVASHVAAFLHDREP